MRVSICGTDLTRKSVLQLEKIIRATVPEHSIQICGRIEDFPRNLRDGTRIVVIVAADASELHRYIALRELLEDVRIIVVLPEDELEMVIEAQKLRPRFMACGESSFPWIGKVLRKMTASITLDPWEIQAP